MITGICLCRELGRKFPPCLETVAHHLPPPWFFGYWLGKPIAVARCLEPARSLPRGQRLNDARIPPPGQPLTGLAACFILLGAAPLGWLGRWRKGSRGGIYLFAIKALMDALAMMGFVRLFRLGGSPVRLPDFRLVWRGHPALPAHGRPLLPGPPHGGFRQLRHRLGGLRRKPGDLRSSPGGTNQLFARRGGGPAAGMAVALMAWFH